MSRGVLLGAAISAACLVAGQLDARADNGTVATEPCVNHETNTWRQVENPELMPGALEYCTGKDCWSFDRKTHAITAIPRRLPPVPTPPRDPAGIATDSRGATLATADSEHVEFCPRGADVRAACKSFALKLPEPASAVYVALNAARTLGTVHYRAEGTAGEEDPASWVVAYNLATGKQVGMLSGSSIRALDHGFWVDHHTFYSASFGKVAEIAAADEAWLALGSTDRIAIHDLAHGDLVLQSTRTGKAVRIPLAAPDPDTWYTFIATPDGATLYAIGSSRAEGEVIAVDTRAGKLIARAAPPRCADGTYRP